MFTPPLWRLTPPPLTAGRPWKENKDLMTFLNAY